MTPGMLPEIVLRSRSRQSCPKYQWAPHAEMIAKANAISFSHWNDDQNDVHVFAFVGPEKNKLHFMQGSHHYQSVPLIKDGDDDDGRDKSAGHSNLAWSIDGKLLVFCQRSTISIWCPRTSEELCQLDLVSILPEFTYQMTVVALRFRRCSGVHDQELILVSANGILFRLPFPRTTGTHFTPETFTFANQTAGTSFSIHSWHQSISHMKINSEGTSMVITGGRKTDQDSSSTSVRTKPSSSVTTWQILDQAPYYELLISTVLVGQDHDHREPIQEAPVDSSSTMYHYAQESVNRWISFLTLGWIPYVFQIDHTVDKGHVQDILFSPDHKYLAILTCQGQISCRETNTWREIVFSLADDHASNDNIFFIQFNWFSSTELIGLSSNFQVWNCSVSTERVTLESELQDISQLLIPSTNSVNCVLLCTTSWNVLEFKSCTFQERIQTLVFEQKSVNNCSEGEESILALANTQDERDYIHQCFWKCSSNRVPSLSSIRKHLHPISSSAQEWVVEQCRTIYPGANLGVTRALFQMGLQKLQQSSHVIKSTELENNAIVSQRQWFLKSLDRLETWKCLFADLPFHAQSFAQFQSADLVRLAKELAQDQRVNEFQVLITRNGWNVNPERLEILAEFPEVLFPYEYAFWLPALTESSMNGNNIENIEQASYYVLNEVEDEIQPWPIRNENQLYDSNNTALNQKKSIQVETPERIEAWYRSRIFEMEQYTHQIHQAMELCRLAQPRVSANEDILARMKQLECEIDQFQQSMARNGMCGSDSTLSLREWCDETSEEHVHLKYQLIFSHQKITLEEKMYRLSNWKLSYVFQQYLTRFLLSEVKEHPRGIDFCAAVIEASNALICPSKRLISKVTDVLSLSIESIYACTQSQAQMEAMWLIFQNLPERDDMEEKRNPIFAKLQVQVDELEGHLQSVEVLAKYHISISMAFFQQVRELLKVPDGVALAQVTKLVLTSIFIRLCSKFESSFINQSKCSNAMNIQQLWTEFQEDLWIIHYQSFPWLSRSEVSAILFQLALRLASISDLLYTKDPSSSFQLVKQLILDNDSMNLELQHGHMIQLILSTSQEMVNAAADLDHPDIDRAKSCLDLISLCGLKVRQNESDINQKIDNELLFLDALVVLRTKRMKCLVNTSSPSSNISGISNADRNNLFLLTPLQIRLQRSNANRVCDLLSHLLTFYPILAMEFSTGICSLGRNLCPGLSASDFATIHVQMLDIAIAQENFPTASEILLLACELGPLSSILITTISSKAFEIVLNPACQNLELKQHICAKMMCHSHWFTPSPAAAAVMQYESQERMYEMFYQSWCELDGMLNLCQTLNQSWKEIVRLFYSSSEYDVDSMDMETRLRNTIEQDACRLLQVGMDEIEQVEKNSSFSGKVLISLYRGTFALYRSILSKKILSLFDKDESDNALFGSSLAQKTNLFYQSHQVFMNAFTDKSHLSESTNSLPLQTTLLYLLMMEASDAKQVLDRCLMEEEEGQTSSKNNTPWLCVAEYFYLYQAWLCLVSNSNDEEQEHHVTQDIPDRKHSLWSSPQVLRKEIEILQKQHSYLDRNETEKAKISEWLDNAEQVTQERTTRSHVLNFEDQFQNIPGLDFDPTQFQLHQEYRHKALLHIFETPLMPVKLIIHAREALIQEQVHLGEEHGEMNHVFSFLWIHIESVLRSPASFLLTPTNVSFDQLVHFFQSSGTLDFMLESYPQEFGEALMTMKQLSGSSLTCLEFIGRMLLLCWKAKPDLVPASDSTGLVSYISILRKLQQMMGDQDLDFFQLIGFRSDSEVLWWQPQTKLSDEEQEARATHAVLYWIPFFIGNRAQLKPCLQLFFKLYPASSFTKEELVFFWVIRSLEKMIYEQHRGSLGSIFDALNALTANLWTKMNFPDVLHVIEQLLIGSEQLFLDEGLKEGHHAAPALGSRLKTLLDRFTNTESTKLQYSHALSSHEKQQFIQHLSTDIFPQSKILQCWSAYFHLLRLLHFKTHLVPLESIKAQLVSICLEECTASSFWSTCWTCIQYVDQIEAHVNNHTSFKGVASAESQPQVMLEWIWSYFKTELSRHETHRHDMWNSWMESIVLPTLSDLSPQLQMTQHFPSLVKFQKCLESESTRALEIKPRLVEHCLSCRDTSQEDLDLTCIFLSALENTNDDPTWHNIYFTQMLRVYWKDENIVTTEESLAYFERHALTLLEGVDSPLGIYIYGWQLRHHFTPRATREDGSWTRYISQHIQCRMSELTDDEGSSSENPCQLEPEYGTLDTHSTLWLAFCKQAHREDLDYTLELIQHSAWGVLTRDHVAKLLRYVSERKTPTSTIFYQVLACIYCPRRRRNPESELPVLDPLTCFWNAGVAAWDAIQGPEEPSALQQKWLELVLVRFSLKDICALESGSEELASFWTQWRLVLGHHRHHSCHRRYFTSSIHYLLCGLSKLEAFCLLSVFICDLCCIPSTIASVSMGKFLFSNQYLAPLRLTTQKEVFQPFVGGQYAPAWMEQCLRLLENDEV